MSGEWSPQRIAVLIALWQQGLTTSGIGIRLGVTKNAVVGKVHRLGLPQRQSPIRQAKPKEPEGEVIKLDALNIGMCSWPYGHPGTSEFRFCGSPIVPGRSYCADHCEIAYVKPSRESKKAAVA